MRDTSDMMEDALSEDTMMDCGGDSSGMEDLVDLRSDVTDSSANIRDVAERLLTILGVDDEEDFLSSSEDEGVEVDLEDFEDDDDDDDDEQLNSRLLHQLAASLAQELKHSRQKQINNSTTTIIEDRRNLETRHHEIPTVEMIQDPSYHEQAPSEKFNNYSGLDLANEMEEKYLDNYSVDGNSFESLVVKKEMSSMDSLELSCLNRRLGLDEFEEGRSSSKDKQLTGFWSAGWDACATEALRYLIEEEGLPAHHPTVLAMKNHLEVQRARAFTQYAV